MHGRHQEPTAASRRLLDLVLAAVATPATADPAAVTEPPTVLALRRSLGHEIAGLRLGGQEAR